MVQTVSLTPLRDLKVQLSKFESASFEKSCIAADHNFPGNFIVLGYILALSIKLVALST
jgi:hypothetical protein